MDEERRHRTAYSTFGTPAAKELENPFINMQYTQTASEVRERDFGTPAAKELENPFINMQYTQTASEVRERDFESYSSYSNTKAVEESDIQLQFLAENLPPFTPQQTQFMKRVYDLQRNKAATSRSFMGELSSDKLDLIENGLVARRDAAAACRSLLQAGRSDLVDQQRIGIRLALQAKGVGVASGYRSAKRQFNNWTSNFGKYYRETIEKRMQLQGGEHGDAAAQYMARYVGQRLAAPGYSLHNSGIAIDFNTHEGKMHLGPNTHQVEQWRQSWFYNWLTANAVKFGFTPNLKIDEPWHWEYRPRSSADKQVSIPSPAKPLMGETLYANIDLTTKNYRDKHRLTGIYIPPSFIRAKAKANVIIYLHGYKSIYPKENATIREYWDTKNFPLFAFREELSESGKNAILVAPTLGPKSESGKLVDVNEGGGLDWYLGQIQYFLQKRGITNEINEVVLACHSGGGFSMLTLAIGNNRSKIIQFWGFDSLYGGKQMEEWLKWAPKNPDKRLYIYYYKSTQIISEKLRKRGGELKFSNISVAEKIFEISYAKTKEQVKTQLKKSWIDPHYWVPITYWQDRLSQLSWS